MSAIDQWEFLGNGIWRHPVYGRVSLNEDYGRTYSANPVPNGCWRTILRTPKGNPRRFRSRETAENALIRLHLS